MRKKVRYLFLVTFATILTAMVLAPANAAMGAGPETHTVTVGGDLPNRGGNGESMYMGYGPSVIVIRAGDSVVWKALDGPHTVTAENLTADGKALFDSHPKVPYPLPGFLFGPGGFIPPGGTFVLDTSKLAPGTYGVLCSLHQDANMQATLTITNQTAPEGYQFPVVTGVSSVSTEVEAFNPKNITVPWGTEVLFENLSGFEPHTVLSVVTLANGTRVLGTVFDSSPMLVPPGLTWDQVPQANAQAISELGGAMFPLPGMDTFSYTFNDPGTYLYYCKYHSLVENGNISGMVGEVIVLPPYASSSDILGINSGIGNATGQAATAMALGTAGLILGAFALVIAVWGSRKNKKTA